MRALDFRISQPSLLHQQNLDELGHKLRRRYAALRQAEITNELEILMTSIN